MSRGVSGGGMYDEEIAVFERLVARCHRRETVRDAGGTASLGLALVTASVLAPPAREELTWAFLSTASAAMGALLVLGALAQVGWAAFVRHLPG